MRAIWRYAKQGTGRRAYTMVTPVVPNAAASWVRKSTVQHVTSRLVGCFLMRANCELIQHPK